MEDGVIRQDNAVSGCNSPCPWLNSAAHLGFASRLPAAAANTLWEVALICCSACIRAHRTAPDVGRPPAPPRERLLSRSSTQGPWEGPESPGQEQCSHTAMSTGCAASDWVAGHNQRSRRARCTVCQRNARHCTPGVSTFVGAVHLRRETNTRQAVNGIFSLWCGQAGTLSHERKRPRRRWQARSRRLAERCNSCLVSGAGPSRPTNGRSASSSPSL